MLTAQQVTEAVRRLGVQPGDSILVHSSFKSLGKTENGADTVIRGLQAAVGENGTVLFPTLCQNDWEHVYENWSPDAPSDVGYLTNYFRRLPGALRSNQATHSVAALGADAAYFTETHGQSGRRYGIFGDTPFAADSPWEKMYRKNTKVLFIGVGSRKCTFRHYAEYCLIADYLQMAAGRPDYEELKAQLWCYDRWSEGGLWPHVCAEYVETLLEREHKVHRVPCGDAVILEFASADFVDCTRRCMEARDPGVFWRDDPSWDVDGMIRWLDTVKKGADRT